MTEQIITKNFYNILIGGGSSASNSTLVYMMKRDLNRTTVYGNGNSDLIQFLKQANTDHIPNYYKLYPVYYSKSLSGFTESEVYGRAYETNFDITGRRCLAAKDDSTGLNTGLKFITTHTNTSGSNEVINGTLLIGGNSSTDSSNYNLILTKFDADITLAPTESYQFTLDLPNLFQSFPATLGS